MIVSLDRFPNKYQADSVHWVTSLVNELPSHQYTLILTHNDLCEQYRSAKIIEGIHMYQYQMLTDRLSKNAAVVIFISASNTVQVLKQNFL